MRFFFVVLSGFALAVVAMPRPAFADSISETCRERYNVDAIQRQVRFQKDNQHDPRLFLVRRCITNERKRVIQSNRIERQQQRDTANFNKSSERALRLRRSREEGITRAIKNKDYNSIVRKLPSQNSRRTLLFQGRASRRLLQRQLEQNNYRVFKLRLDRLDNQRNLSRQCIGHSARYNIRCQQRDSQ